MKDEIYIIWGFVVMVLLRLFVSGGDVDISIEFVAPTPPDSHSTTNTSVEINITIEEPNLDEVKYNWNGTNYTLYNDSLVLMMNFNKVSALGENDTHVEDLSSYGNDGTFESNGTEHHGYDSSGKFGGGWVFDGDGDYIEIADDNSNDFDGNFTLSAWIKHSGAPESQGDGWRIISKQESGSQNLYHIRIADSSSNVPNGNIEFEIRVSGGEIYEVSSITNVKDNNWHHIVGLREGSDIKVYIDGVFENTTSAISSAINQVGDLHIGAMGAGGAYKDPFNGTIDEVAIWNRALSAEEINQSYMGNLHKYDEDKWALYVNQTNAPNSSGLAEGDYTYFANAKDNSDNENRTEIRTFTISSQCNPMLNEDWVITDEQICSSQDVTTGTDIIKINSGGSLWLKSSSVVKTSGIELATTGDLIYIDTGCQIQIV